jgi:meiotically up-regulated gene 157 (Mug157) protein
VRTLEQKRHDNALKEKAEELLDSVARGAETYALWHHVDVGNVYVAHVMWNKNNVLVVEFQCR